MLQTVYRYILLHMPVIYALLYYQLAIHVQQALKFNNHWRAIRCSPDNIYMLVSNCSLVPLYLVLKYTEIILILVFLCEQFIAHLKFNLHEHRSVFAKEFWDSSDILSDG